MKKLLISGMIFGAFAFGTNAYADTINSKVEAGTTPDSIFYPFDKLFENIHLTFTIDPKEKSDLLMQYLQERLSEAKQMTDEDKPKDADKALSDYMDKMDEAKDTVAEVVSDQNTSEDVKQQLTENLDESTVVPDDVKQELSQDTQTSLEDKQDEVQAVASAVKNVDPAVVQKLREQGLGYGQIAQVQFLADVTGKSIDEISSLFGKGHGFGKVVKSLGLKPSIIKEKVLTQKLSDLQSQLQAANDSGDQEKIKELQSEMDKLQSKLDSLANDDSEKSVKTEKDNQSDAQKSSDDGDNQSVVTEDNQKEDSGAVSEQTNKIEEQVKDNTGEKKEVGQKKAEQAKEKAQQVKKWGRKIAEQARSKHENKKSKSDHENHGKENDDEQHNDHSQKGHNDNEDHDDNGDN